MSDIKFVWAKEWNGQWVASAEVSELGSHLPKAGDQINVYKRDGSFQTKIVKKAQALQGVGGLAKGISCFVLHYIV